MRIPTFFAFEPDDTVETRAEKFTVLLVAGSCCLAAVVWTLMYYRIFGPSLTTLLPLLFVIIVGSSLLISHATGNHYYTIYALIISIIYITALIQWSIGGVFESGLVMIWAYIGPLTALMFLSLRQSVFWLLLYLVNIAITVVFNDFFASQGQNVAATTQTLFFFMNLTIASIVVFLFAGYFVRSAVNEREKANKLLLNVLPKEIAPILKAGNKTIAQHFDSASVLFADIVGSTPLFSDLEPAEAVDWLNEIFSRFDRLVEMYGLEKISTSGDNYMVAAGVPLARPGHARAIAALALAMIEESKKIAPRNGRQIQFRVGIHSGPLLAGVIGDTKFHYDLWGDTVNVASRMESHGEGGRIQISKATHDLLGDEFESVARGKIPIKGKGEMETWYLLKQRSQPEFPVS